MFFESKEISITNNAVNFLKIYLPIRIQLFMLYYYICTLFTYTYTVYKNK